MPPPTLGEPHVASTTLPALSKSMLVPQMYVPLQPLGRHVMLACVSHWYTPFALNFARWGGNPAVVGLGPPPKSMLGPKIPLA